MDPDLTLRIEQPASLLLMIGRTLRSWNRSNRMSLIIIMRGILEAFRGAVSDDITLVKDFLIEIEK